MTLKTRRRFLQELAFIAGSASFMTSFKSPGSVPSIGFLSGALTELDTAFTEELKKLGFKDGETIFIERRFTQPNTNDTVGFAQELAKMKLALIVAGALPFAIEVRKANPQMPHGHCHMPWNGKQWFCSKSGAPWWYLYRYGRTTSRRNIKATSTA